MTEILITTYRYVFFSRSLFKINSSIKNLLIPYSKNNCCLILLYENTSSLSQKLTWTRFKHWSWDQGFENNIIEGLTVLHFSPQRERLRNIERICCLLRKVKKGFKAHTMLLHIGLCISLTRYSQYMDMAAKSKKINKLCYDFIYCG